MTCRILLSLALAVALPAAVSVSAATLDVPRLPPPTFADREVSRDIAIPVPAVSGMRRFRLQLAFNATPSNNVQIAFGRDAEPMDGALDAGETALIVGWDSGEWFLRPAGLRERLVHAPAGGLMPRRRRLDAFIRLSARGAPAAAGFSDDDGSFTFDGLALTPLPDWLMPEDWSHLRVTVRGAAIAEEDVRVRLLPDGAIIMVR
jgi:hypothetical protein